ncbi:hypothetical protein GJ629_03425 [Halapricum sp. CBA1109]|uniref:DUF7529 family protein n=1 Tax=Halapricum sp. CBA1109 TaxID=2668068 RepID=UPI0012FAFBE3|nr:hypothetical protein [Halapricum sp. CBA1109]MUV89066.1 hypothetical protein [Halapricum sp. CBA1109]
MDDTPQYVDRVIDDTGRQTDAWSRTLDDMEAIAERRREDGWDAVTLTTAQTAPLSRDDGDDPERFGLVTVLPDNYAEEFTEVYEENALDQYQAYSNVVEGFMYLLLEVLDSDSKTTLLLAMRYDLVLADAMATSAYDEGTLFTHVKTIDGTELGTFQHDDFEALLPPRFTRSADEED